MKQKGPACRQAGQIILILILIMTVALGIGLSIVQKSLVDLSTASKVDQSSRAFSAAEAGVEKALKDNKDLKSFSDTGSQITNITDTGLIPCVPGSPGCAQQSGVQAALEYPPLAKEDVVQVWLVDPNANLPNCVSPSVCYTQTTLDVFWGNSQTDKAALELTLIYFDGSSYKPRKWYLDNASAGRQQNNFDQVACGGYPLGVNTYQCYIKLGNSSVNVLTNGALQSIVPNTLMLLRARLLYNTNSQPFAVQAVGTCNPGCSLPPQARSIESTGVAGETQRKVRLFQENKVVPPFFDYAIFSAGQISKN